MKLLYQIDWLAPWPEAGGDDLTFYRRMSAAYSQRLALAKAYIEQSEHRPGCMYPCTCGRDALLMAMTPDQPPPSASVTCPRCHGFGVNHSSSYLSGSAQCLLCGGAGKVVPRGDGSYSKVTAPDQPSECECPVEGHNAYCPNDRLIKASKPEDAAK